MKLSTETLVVEIQPVVFEKQVVWVSRKTAKMALFAIFGIWGLQIEEQLL